MVKKLEMKVIDTKGKSFNKYEAKSEQELSNADVLKRLTASSAEIDPMILSMILSNIDNFSGLTVKQQEFIAEMADKQKCLDEKALDNFNVTKNIISEVLRSNPSMDRDTMIYLVDSLKETDRHTSDYAREAGNRMERFIKYGMAVSGSVAAVVLAIILKGKL